MAIVVVVYVLVREASTWVGMKNLALFVAHCVVQLQTFDCGMTLIVGYVRGLRFRLMMDIVILILGMQCLSSVELLQVKVVITVGGSRLVLWIRAVFRVEFL